MSQDSETTAVEEDKEDRISDLPRHIIDSILELLPAQDAARTSILSKKWRNVWSMLPYLILDTCFCNELTEKSYSIFIEIVYAILLLHRGDIIKFVLDVPEEHLASYTEIDRWLLYVTRNGVKVLTLSIHGQSYQLPSCVYNCTNLTRLDLCNCDFEPTNSFLTFPKLETLRMEGVTVMLATECVINAPRLIELELIHCDDTQYLNIVSPLLELLRVHDNHYLVLKCFMNCKQLRQIYIRFMRMVDDLKHDERSTSKKLFFGLAPTLEKLCSDSFLELLIAEENLAPSLEKLIYLAPTLEKLCLVSFLLELLIAEKNPAGPRPTFNCLRFVALLIDFGELSSIFDALQFIRSVPNLSELDIHVKGTNDEAESVLKYLITSTYLDQPLNKLKHVVFRHFWGSKVELHFVKFLLATTPSLVSMTVELVMPGSNEESILMAELMRPGSRDVRAIVTELMISLRKASPKAELYLKVASLP